MRKRTQAKNGPLRRCARRRCRSSFLVQTPWHRYCSTRCKQIAWYLAQADRWERAGVTYVFRRSP